jgi:hypothetical protein
MHTRLVSYLRLLPLAPALALTGCFRVSGAEYAKCQRELLDTQSQVRTLQDKIAAQEQTIELQKSQVAQQAGVNPKDLEQLVVPVKIQLERLSGGYQEGDKPGDAGVLLYVQPIDRNGDVIKAAGSISVTVLDLANPPDRYVISECHFDVNKTRELWYGQMWTHHFAVKCPWPPGHTPQHDEITVRVEFTDLLTGKKLDTQGVYKIKLPPKQVTEK